MAFLGRLSVGRVLLLGFFCAVVLEAITVVLRFGLGLESTRDTTLIGAATFRLRIHHGYIGLVLLVAAFRFRGGLRNLILIVGLGLVISDLFHHFLVLWPLTGSPQFDLFYPAPPPPVVVP
jgi:hypothetical protein